MTGVQTCALPIYVGEHGPLLRAIAAGDGEKAADLAHDHVIGFEAAIRIVI